jgi:hypothetical protein
MTEESVEKVMQMAVDVFHWCYLPRKGIDFCLDVRFISSLPVMQRPACKVWADKRLVQIVWAVR